MQQNSLQPQNQPKKGSKKKKIVIAVIVVLLILAIFGGVFWWMIWGRQPSFLGDQVDLSLSSEKEIASGNKIDLTLIYVNNEKVALEDLEINVLYPDGFIFENSTLTPEKDSKNRFVKEKIAAGEQDKITISGRLLGNPRETKTFTATFSFKPENVSSRFSREAACNILITKSQLQLETTLSKMVRENELLKYKVTIKNTAEEEIKNLQVKMEFPNSFDINQVNPKQKGENLWEFEKLKTNQEEAIEIEGKLYAEAGETKIFKISAGQKDEKGEFYLQNEKEIQVKVAKLDLSLQAQINKQQSLAVNFGDEVELKVHYKNKSSDNLPNVVMEAAIDESIFDKSAIKVEGGKYEKGKIWWDKSGKSELANLDKSAEGDLVARLKILSDIPVASSSDKNFSTTIKAKLSSDLKDIGGGVFSKESNEAEIKINTKVGYNIEIRYYDQNGKKIVGSGPLPPKTGFETTYRVYLTLTNTSNDVEKSKAEIYLPENISFAGGKTAASGILDFFDGKMIWNLDKLQAGIGKLKPQLQASFDISITPDKSMIGKTPKLIEKSSFSGRDSFTGSEIKIERGLLTTELERDLKAREMGGKVVE